MAQHPIELILLKQVASQLALPIFLVNPDGDLLYYNEPAEAILGRRYDETGELPVSEWSVLFTPEDADGRPVPARTPSARARPGRAPPGARRIRHPRPRRHAPQAVGHRGAHRRTRGPLPRCGRPVLGRGNRVKVVFWGTRGSLASPGPETVRYGGNTVCVEVRVAGDHVLVLDAGSGIRRLGDGAARTRRKRVDLSAHAPPHGPHRRARASSTRSIAPDLDVHIWGPASTTLDLSARLSRYSVAPVVPGPHARPRLPAHAARRSARYVRCSATSSSAARSSRIRDRRSGYRDRARARHRHVPDGSRTRARRRQLSRAGRVDVGLRPRASAPTC